MPESRCIFSEWILNIEHLYEAIFAYSTRMSVLRTQRTCKTANSAVSSYLARILNVNRLLSRYFPDPIAFRSLQACTATLISGSTALQFFDRAYYPESDLDLYVWFRYGRAVARWLLTHGYEFVPSREGESLKVDEASYWSEMDCNEYGELPNVAAVLTFSKRGPRQHGRVAGDASANAVLKVQVIVTVDVPMAAIFSFHSTCVMNVITYEKAYCLYPRATLEHRVAVETVPHNIEDRDYEKARAEALAKYRGRGWRVFGAGDELEPYLFSSSDPRHGEPLASFHLGSRWIDDGESWVVPLDVKGVLLPPAANAMSRRLVHDPSAICNWRMFRYGDASVVVMGFRAFTTDVFRYGYLMDPGRRQKQFIRDLDEIFEQRFQILVEEVGMFSLRVYDEADLWGMCRVHRMGPVEEMEDSDEEDSSSEEHSDAMDESD